MQGAQFREAHLIKTILIGFVALARTSSSRGCGSQTAVAALLDLFGLRIPGWQQHQLRGQRAHERRHPLRGVRATADAPQQPPRHAPEEFAQLPHPQQQILGRLGWGHPPDREPRESRQDQLTAFITVVREIPSRVEIQAIGIPSAASLLINAGRATATITNRDNRRLAICPGTHLQMLRFLVA